MYAKRMRGLFLLLACAGCSSILGIDDFKLGDAGTDPGDVATDGPPIDVPDSCLGPSGFAVCLQQMPSMPFNYDTTSPQVDTSPGGTYCLPTQPTGWIAQGQPEACFIVGTTINLQATLRATGSRPLVLVATDTITIVASGSGIDVAARRGPTQQRPAGSPSTDCVLPQPPGEAGGGNLGHGGGAGGTFMTRGGPGGFGAGGQNVGGQPPAMSNPPTKLRAGCEGGFGGRGQAPAGSNPKGGGGGGAVFLVAKNRIVNDGIINASGAGGEAGDFSSGGAGGGSGGMIMLHAATISGAGIVMANGGGGAGGSSSFTMGTPGQEPPTSAPNQPAAGGGGGMAPGGTGFAGTSQAGPGGPGQQNNNGGGGGGGAAGYVRFNVQVQVMQVSPAASIVP